MGSKISSLLHNSRVEASGKKNPQAEKTRLATRQAIIDTVKMLEAYCVSFLPNCMPTNMPAPVARSILTVYINCRNGNDRLIALTASSLIKLPTIMASTTLPKQAERAMRMDAHRKRQNWLLNAFFSSVVILVSYYCEIALSFTQPS